MTTWKLSTRADTARFGEALGRLLFPGAVVALIGEVGAGKTTLTRAIARGMGITEPVSSPTFALIHVYPGRIPLFHFDPYRLDRLDQLYDVGFLDYFEQAGAVVVEWADKFPEMLPPDRLVLRMMPVDREAELGESEDSSRILMGAADGPAYDALLTDLGAEVALRDLRAGE